MKWFWSCLSLSVNLFSRHCFVDLLVCPWCFFFTHCHVFSAGLAQYSGDPKTEWHLNAHSTKVSLLEAIANLPYKGGNTMTGDWTFPLFIRVQRSQGNWNVPFHRLLWLTSSFPSYRNGSELHPPEQLQSQRWTARRSSQNWCPDHWRKVPGRNHLQLPEAERQRHRALRYRWVILSEMLLHLRGN